MKCPCEDEMYLCETPCNRDSCAYQQGYQDGGSDMEQAKQIIIDELLKQIEQIRADAINEVISEIANWNTNSNKKIPYAFARHLEQLLDLIDIGKREVEIKNQSIFKEICDIQFEAIDKMQKVFEETEGTKSDRK